MTHRVLVVEDEANYRQVFGMMIADLDIELLEAEDGEAALSVLAREEVDLVVTDLNMPRLDGMALLKKLQAQPQPPPVVVVTAYGTVDSAVEAMRHGAIDYLTKPFDEQRLHLTLRRAFRVLDLVRENRRLRETLEASHDFSQIVGESPALVDALQLAGRISASDSTVLVRGESGTGKELVACAIHYNSARAARTFVAVNCAALPDTLLEAELFGAEAGAYTGARKRKGRVELAAGGTLFLDEIGDMPLALQAKLLRLIQERTFTPLGSESERTADVRFVCATNRALDEAVADGTFREDLFYRINVLPVWLPPLRERGADILLLAETFITHTCEKMGRRPMQLTAAARAALTGYHFPGNVRELANLIERAVILTDGDLLDGPDLNLIRPAESAPKPPPAPAPSGEIVLPEDGVVLEQVERSLISQALKRSGGNKTQAAKLLGLSRATLRYRIEKLELE